MSRSRYIWDPETRQMVQIPTDYQPRPRVHIQGVRQPWKSMFDGKMYDGRLKYEAEARAQGYEIVGNQADWRGYEAPAERGPSFGDKLAKTASEMGISD